MKAVRIVRVGAPLEECDVPLPSPGPGEVRIRVAAAGICRSDVHYRAGFPRLANLPRTPGHEIAGTIDAVGPGGDTAEIGKRVCVHYQVSCTACDLCSSAREQFCLQGAMIGKDRDGGYAEAVVVPERNAYAIPDTIAAEQAAVMMCSTATAYHALRRTRLSAGERVAVLGVGGLGMSAVQLAFLLGAEVVYAVDVDPTRLEMAEAFGAIAAPAGQDPVGAVRAHGGVDVALDLVGSAAVMRQGLEMLRPGGRLGAVGLTSETMSLAPYLELVAQEAEVLGVSDHLGDEIPDVLEFCRSGDLDLDPVITGRVPLAAGPINETMNHLEAAGGGGVRTVIVADG